MVQNSFISLILQEEKEENRGSVEFQVFSWTNKIRRLTSHLELHRKDYSSQRLLSYLSKKKRVLICQRKHQRLRSYLSKKKRVLYKYLINQLGIRESKTR